MKKVLIFSYYWPPGSGPGVQRVLKFCKYLPRFDWEPIVVTVRDGSYPSTDPSLLEELPDDLRVHATDTRDPFRLYNVLQGKKGKAIPVAMGGIRNSKSPVKRLALWIRANWFIPDARKGWKKFALREARRIIASENIDLIFTSSPPHSSQFVGYELREETGIPWVADFRDPWTSIYYNEYLPRTEASTRKDQEMEDLILRSADYVTVVSPGLKAEFGDRAKAIRVIYNGYDEEDMKPVRAPRKDQFVLAYVGNFKSEQNISAVWQALAELKQEIPEFAKALSLEFTGNVDPAAVQSIKRAGLESNLKLFDFVPHKEATRRMSAACGLLFVIPRSEGSAVIVTGKLFEYLASGTYIWGIGPVGGNADQILRECGREAIHDYEDVPGMKGALGSAFEKWRRGDPGIYAPSDSLRRYSREGQTRQLAGLFDELVEAP